MTVEINNESGVEVDEQRLVSLGDDLSVLISRHVNDRESLDRLLRPNGKAIEPLDPALRPHPRFLAWHRDNVYKM